MRSVIAFLFFAFLNFESSAQITGLWQGILMKSQTDFSNSAPFFLNITVEDGRVSGQTREEISGTAFYAIGKYYGELTDSSLHFKHVVYQKKIGNSRITWCKLEADLVYNKETGYLEGEYKSTDCRNSRGRIILFRSTGQFSEDELKIASHSAKDQLVKDLKKGRPAPEIREIQRQNFKFIPIYFDYAKADIRPEYKTFLLEMVEIIDGHSDLRIKVVGNTDSDGSDKYNEKLSIQRAQAIISFFVANGLSADRIVLEFNGEKKPVDRNDTEEGKQRNRRVEFEFI